MHRQVRCSTVFNGSKLIYRQGQVDNSFNVLSTHGTLLEAGEMESNCGDARYTFPNPI